MPLDFFAPTSLLNKLTGYVKKLRAILDMSNDECNYHQRRNELTSLLQSVGDILKDGLTATHKVAIWFLCTNIYAELGLLALQQEQIKLAAECYKQAKKCVINVHGLYKDEESRALLTGASALAWIKQFNFYQIADPNDADELLDQFFAPALLQAGAQQSTHKISFE